MYAHVSCNGLDNCTVPGFSAASFSAASFAAPHLRHTQQHYHLQDKLQLYLDRLLILQQRLRRHPVFNKPALSGMGGSHQDYCEVSQAQDLVGVLPSQDGPESFPTALLVLGWSCAMPKRISLRFKPCLL